MKALILSSLLAAATLVGACGDAKSSPTDAGSPFAAPKDAAPTSATDTGAADTDAAPTVETARSDAGAPCAKPAGCFCGTPTTQKQWLNRCTDSVAIPLNTQFKAGAPSDLP